MSALNNPNLWQDKCYVNGKWVLASDKQSIEVINPFNQNIIGTVPSLGKKEIAEAIEAAHNAFSQWRQLSAQERAHYLVTWSNLIEQNKKDLALIMTLEQGKPYKESLAEINYANGFINWFAHEGRRVYGDVIPANNSSQHLVIIKQAIGVVGAITPWNFPSAMITRKVGAALAAGCTIVVKPDSQTPFSALALAALAEEAQIPAGVFNIVTGDAEMIGKTLTQHDLVKKISFTGSTHVGKLLMSQCANSIKKITLELGGNAPFIVFDDADLDAAVKGAVASKFRNAGQTCVCANRIFVHENIIESFTEKFLQATKSLTVGNGLDEKVQIGPVINKQALDKIEKHIADAVSKGGKLLYGGNLLNGLLFSPTIITNCNENMLLAQEETFGPVAPIFKFSSDEEVIEAANATPYGLASYFYSNNIKRIWKVAEALEYGMVGINTGIISTEVAPFGGIKQSGIGREGSKYGIEPYLEIKYLCMG